MDGAVIITADHGNCEKMIDENGEKFVSETDMEYELKIRTTTNLPLSYELYKNQSIDVPKIKEITASNKLKLNNLKNKRASLR